MIYHQDEPNEKRRIVSFFPICIAENDHRINEGLTREEFVREIPLWKLQFDIVYKERNYQTEEITLVTPLMFCNMKKTY